jgi:hypothetical protein
MQKVAIFTLLTLAVQSQAKRVQVQLVDAELENAEAEEAQLAKAEEEMTLAEDDAEEERAALDRPEDSYWFTNRGTWHFLAPSLMNNQFTQQYELKEDYRTLRTKKYDVKLDQYEDANTQVELRKNINAKVLRSRTTFGLCMRTSRQPSRMSKALRPGSTSCSTQSFLPATGLGEWPRLAMRRTSCLPFRNACGTIIANT